MKPITILLMSALLVLALACEKAAEQNKTQDLAIQSVDRTNRLAATATLESTGAGDTVTQDLGFYGFPTSLYVQIGATQVSGTTSGNAYLQYDPGVSGSDWVNIDTVALSGASTIGTATHLSLGGRYRYFIPAPD